MCGRSSLTKTEKEIEERFGSTFYSDELEQYNPLPNYNVAPSHYHPIITNQDPEHIHLYRWGLIPFWAKDPRIAFKMINARVETIAEKSAFKNALHERRCIVPMDGFYEWQKHNGDKIPYRIMTTDQEIFSVAGLWENWKKPSTGEDVFTFTVITQNANDKLTTIHDRMPAVLTPETERLWLSNDLSTHDLLDLITPYPNEKTAFYQVSKEVGNVRNNSKQLIEKVEGEKPSPNTTQGSLF